mmetsp:Transcript_28991/g.69640  ORF Transcript_28991/g.69640 Transcript_28991/m.69640 type:complete len:368 (-) Transcript_28991:293-1396(-)
MERWSRPDRITASSIGWLINSGEYMHPRVEDNCVFDEIGSNNGTVIMLFQAFVISAEMSALVHIVGRLFKDVVNTLVIAGLVLLSVAAALTALEDPKFANIGVSCYELVKFALQLESPPMDDIDPFEADGNGDKLNVDVSKMNPFAGKITGSGATGQVGKLFVWRIALVVSHILIFGMLALLWYVNKTGKWAAVTRGWSRSYMQIMSVQKYDPPVLGENALGQETLTGVQFHSSLLWPRTMPLLHDGEKTVFSYDCNNDTVSGENLFEFLAETREGGVFSKDKSCQQNSIVPTYDYSTTFGILAFLGSIDVMVFTVLCMWVATGYAVFSIPNESHGEYELTAAEEKGGGVGWWGFWCNRAASTRAST